MRFFYEHSDSGDDDGSDSGAEQGSVRGRGRPVRKGKGKGKGKGMGRERTGLRLEDPSTSSSSSSGSSSSSTSSSDDDGLDDSGDGGLSSDDDSEEDAFPVHPRNEGGGDCNSNGNGRRHLNKYPSQVDPLEVYLEKEQQRAWERAQASHNRDLAALRAIRVNAFARATQVAQKSADDELELVRLVLEGFDLRRREEEKRIDDEFADRNRRRWLEIDRAIQAIERKAAEEEEAANALEATRLKQQQAEERARSMREVEERKVVQEKEKEKEKEATERAERERAASEREEKARSVKQKEEEEAARKSVGQAGGGAGGGLATPPPAAPASASAPTAALGTLATTKAEFDRWHVKMKDIKETVLPAVSANQAWRNACYQLKKKLSTRISNISASRADIQAKSSEIHSLLNDSRATPQTYQWSLNLLSKRIIGMANMSNDADLSPVTFALAQLVVALLVAGHADLGDILMARFVKRCPYVIPYYPMRSTTSKEDFLALIGRKPSEDTINYNQRMSGIVALYAAITQTSPSSVPHLLPPGTQPNLSAVPSYFRPEAGWRWYALIVRPPLTLLDLTPLLLYCFLRMTGERFYDLYGRQFVKLLRAIAEKGIDEKAVRWNEGVQGDLSKVRLLIGDWLANGRVVGAEGRTPT